MVLNRSAWPRTVALTPLAFLEHDFGESGRLLSYPPVPDDQVHGADLLARHAFGSLVDGIKSPRTIYICCWRDPDAYLRMGKDQDRPPGKILLVANFAGAAFENPPDLIQAAEQYNRMVRGSVRLDLDSDGSGGFAFQSLTFEMSDPALGRRHSFRSCWKAGEMAGLDFNWHIEAPRSLLDPVRFAVSGRLPRRYNHGAEVEASHVSFSAAGGAVPLPGWVNY